LISISTFLEPLIPNSQYQLAYRVAVHKAAWQGGHADRRAKNSCHADGEFA
jgi:hypothetical protein